MEQDLQQNVAHLFAEMCHIAFIERFQYFIGFFEQEGTE